MGKTRFLFITFMLIKQYTMFKIYLLTLLWGTMACSASCQDIQAPAVAYGNNILCFAPALINNTGPGIGLSYERLLDEQGRISCYFPFYYTRRNSGWAYNEHYKTDCLGGMAGIKLYPGSSRGAVRYAFGFGFPFDALSRKTDKIDSHAGIYEVNRTDHFVRSGILFLNSLTITLARKIVMGLDLNIGFSFSDEKDYDNSVPFALLSFRAGYRF